MRWTSLSVCLLLAACQQGPTRVATSPEGSAPSASSLERAAIETGVIADPARVPAIGLYQRSHEAGRDTLCVIPAQKGEARFGLEASFGEGLSCRGRGRARRAGDKLILSFSGGDRCIIVAQYDGDQVSLPGVVDLKCADLCDGRGSLEGVTFPRLAGDAPAALRARDSGGEVLCEPD